MRTARRLFGRHGYAATSLQQIVDGARVTKGALYHHFEGKQELFFAVFAEVKRELADRVSARFFGSGYAAAGDPWDDLVAWCEALLEAHFDPAAQRICLIDAPAALGLEAIRAVDAQHGEVLLRGTLRRAMNHGAIERQPLRPLARLLTAALFDACLQIVASADRGAARAEVWPVFLRLLAGLRPR